MIRKVENTWLLFDVPNVCWRSYHAIQGGLSFGNQPTEALFGFFRELMTAVQTHQTKNCAFFFDTGPYKRKLDFPAYKVKRKTPDEEKARVFQQIERLKTTLLPELGYSNICFHQGYEADDLIATTCQFGIGQDDEAIIISTDKDLWQLLSDRVSVWQAKKGTLYTAKAFMGEYGIPPKSWAKVKAIAGCVSDDIPGVKGVGELTALRYLLGVLKKNSAYGRRITDGKQTILRNLKLVTLPYDKDCPTFHLKKDHPSRSIWKQVMNELGMERLASKS